MRKLSRAGRRRGFVLVDAVVALGIGTVVLVAFLKMLITVYATADSLGDSTVAYNAARQIIENVRAYKGNTFAAGTYNATTFGAVPQLSNLRSSSATIIVTSHTTKIKKLSIRIQWKSGSRGGSSRLYDAVALVSARGVTP